VRWLGHLFDAPDPRLAEQATDLTTPWLTVAVRKLIPDAAAAWSRRPLGVSGIIRIHIPIDSSDNGWTVMNPHVEKVSNNPASRRASAPFFVEAIAMRKAILAS
jgi:hypothetical protein